jgi:hypothetical protein
MNWLKKAISYSKKEAIVWSKTFKPKNVKIFQPVYHLNDKFSCWLINPFLASNLHFYRIVKSTHVVMFVPYRIFI